MTILLHALELWQGSIVAGTLPGTQSLGVVGEVTFGKTDRFSLGKTVTELLGRPFTV